MTRKVASLLQLCECIIEQSLGLRYTVYQDICETRV